MLRLWGRRWRGGPVLECTVPELRGTGYGWSGRDGGRRSRKRNRSVLFVDGAHEALFVGVTRLGRWLLHVTKARAPGPAAVVGNGRDEGRRGLGGKDSSRVAPSQVRVQVCDSSNGSPSLKCGEAVIRHGFSEGQWRV